MNTVNSSVTPMKTQQKSGNIENSDLPDRFSRILLQKKGHEQKEEKKAEPGTDEGILLDVPPDLTHINKKAYSQDKQEGDSGGNFSGLAPFINAPVSELPSVVTQTTSQLRIECIDKIFNDLLNISLSDNTADNKTWEFTYSESSILKYEVLVKKTDVNTLHVQLTGFNTSNVETKYMLSELQKKLSKKMDTVNIQSDTDSAMRVILRK